MIFYFLVYMFSVFLLFVTRIIREDERKYIIFINLFLLFIISGTRTMPISDYRIYQHVFDSVPDINNFLKNSLEINILGMEKGYLLLNSIVKTLGLNFEFLTLLVSGFIYISFYKGLNKYTDNFSLLIILFLYKFFPYNTLVSIRQPITIGIFFISLKYIEEKKLIKYYILTIIAISFHNGAIIMLVLYPLLQMKLTKKRLVILNLVFLPTIIVSFLNYPILSKLSFLINIFSDPLQYHKASSLFQSEAMQGINLFHSLEYFLIMALLIINYEKIITTNKHSEFIIKLFLCLLPLMTLFRGYELLTREKDYFTLTYGIILSYILINQKAKSKILYYFIIIAICAWGYFRWIYLFGTVIPYQTYLL